MASNQLSIFGGDTSGDILTDIEAQGFAWVDHQIGTDYVDGLIKTYAHFTDNFPDPSLETVNAMIPSGFDAEVLKDLLDDLEYENDQETDWHKYKTNFPSFAKPGGYTNRSLQVNALKEVRGVILDDDPKEFYHFHPNSTVKINGQRKKYGWPSIPPEVHELHKHFAAIHALGAKAVTRAYAALENYHPELIPEHFGPNDVVESPVRLLFYHPGQGEKLAQGHYDKAMSTLQIAESHLGLWIKDPETGRVVRTSNLGAFFAGKMFSDKKIGVYPDSIVRPGWHGVDLDNTLSEDRQVHGRNVSRWAIIFFANSLAAGAVLDKSLTHTAAEDGEAVA